VTTPSAPLETRELERVAPPFEPNIVEELLRLFGKAARAHQLYLPNNPVYKSAHDALRAGFSPVWEETDELVLTFTESEVKWEGMTVLTEGSRGSESLPWSFYKDGVRELRLLRGFEAEELDKLLGKTAEKGLTVVPLRMYFKKGRLKVVVALSRGKKMYDKRETIRRRETDRETRSAVKTRRV